VRHYVADLLVTVT